MRTCQACGREFSERQWHLECLWCGYDNSRSALPYSEGYVEDWMEKRKRDDEDAAKPWFESDINEE